MRILRIAIIDDDEMDLGHLRDVIETYVESRNLLVEIDVFSSGETFMKSFRPKKYEVIFIDNYIGNGLGIDFARKARAMDDKTEFVFVSMSPEFAVSSFDVRALHYLIKPATPEAISEVFNRLWRHTPEPESPMIEVTTDRHPILIPIKSIRYIQILNKTCCIYGEEEIQVHIGLEKMMELLPPDEFIRTHKSFIIRLDCIQSMNLNEFILEGNVTIPIGRAYQKQCKSAYIEYFANKRTK